MAIGETLEAVAVRRDGTKGVPGGREGSVEGGKPRCNRCGHEGHQGHQCESRTNGIPCGTCGNTGHTEAMCRTKKKNALGTVACSGCGEFDHTRQHCPWKAHQCTTCTKTGHTEAVCWEKKKPTQAQSKAATPTPAKHLPQALLDGHMWFSYICQECDVPIRDPDLIAVVCPNPQCKKPIKDSKCGTDEAGQKKTLLPTLTKESILLEERIDGAADAVVCPNPQC